MAETRTTADRLLDSFCALLIEGGEKSATLEAVAARAGVSKGGLLYHFGSKKALVDGVLARLHRFVEEDDVAMAAAPEGPVAYFIRTSTDAGTQYDVVINATVALAQGGDRDATAALAETRSRWHDALMAEVHDADIALALLFMSDGLYFASALPEAYPELNRRDATDFAERMLAVARRLTTR
ncbi:DNA-binding transcriptional regulator, AcrR family [Paramicrobacterium humi]|uniref:DNA-binding transcriptional regulator, AcrR family n=1 Tax=Paramicrobacterium humi TaxID=640635 RepID=A0A1H4K2G5_9MICO|nr:TetR/AcrR family transcriptional regulator [Microbacterium humi]SEB52258.1 DNA-binding transcriptional regulator, AcrR family [Microbacterium humi]